MENQHSKLTGELVNIFVFHLGLLESFLLTALSPPFGSVFVLCIKQLSTVRVSWYKQNEKKICLNKRWQLSVQIVPISKQSSVSSQ